MHSFFNLTRASGLRKIFLGITIILVGSVPALWASHLLFFKSSLRNVADLNFFRVAQPPGFIEQSLQSPSLHQFQMELPPDLLHAQPSLAKAVCLRHWVHQQQPEGESWIAHPLTWSDRLQGDTENPMAILIQQRQGAWATCKRFAYLLVGAAESAGMRARVISVSSTPYKSLSAGHTMAEIWIPELHQWVLMDAMLDSMFTVDHRPASALDVYQAVHSNYSNHVQTVHNRVPGRVRNLALQKTFRHLYVAMSNAIFDGYGVCFSCKQAITFAHLSNKFSPDYPENWKRTALIITSLTTLMGGVLVFYQSLQRFWNVPTLKARALAIKPQ